MKKLIFMLLAVCICFSTLITFVFADNGVNWYFKKNGNKRPIFDSKQIEMEKYDIYYLDKKVNDDSKDKVLYLTFDAGYENGNVEKILNTLKSKNATAAFFLLDNIILKNTELVKRMVADGHLICNHTKNHKDLTKLSSDEIKKNITDLEKIYEQKTGFTMSKYFRFPEGRYNEESLKTIQSMGYKTIFWSFGYPDWDNSSQPSKEKAIKVILDNTHNGAVILLHPTSSTNAEILPTLIDEWRNMGYRFGSLDELTKKQY